MTARETLREDELISPVAEMGGALQQCHGRIERLRRAAGEARERGLLGLAGLAVLVVQLEQALSRYEADLETASLPKVHRHLRVLKDQMLDALREEGLEILVPLGAAFGEVAESVRVQGWRHAEEYEAEVVAEVLEPIVLHEGRLLRSGRVVMGAPPGAIHEP